MDIYKIADIGLGNGWWVKIYKQIIGKKYAIVGTILINATYNRDFDEI